MLNKLCIALYKVEYKKIKDRIIKFVISIAHMLCAVCDKRGRISAFLIWCSFLIYQMHAYGSI